MRAESLLRRLDALLVLRPRTKAAMIVAGRQPGWKALRSTPFFGPVRVAPELAIMSTPFRFLTKRQRWPFIGLGRDHPLERRPGARLIERLSEAHS